MAKIVKINDGDYINLDNVFYVRIKVGGNKFYWDFYKDDPIEHYPRQSCYFDSKEQAEEWLENLIKK